jgi:GNAT superfamily N-acetyltransferase
MRMQRIGARNIPEFTRAFSGVRELAVNSKIGFYGPEELKAWTKKPKDNLLYVCVYGGKYVGFCFAKIMSPHWALIDTFYVKPDMRRFGIGIFMQRFIDAEIKKLGLHYISRVTRLDNDVMHKFLEKAGYSKRDKYTWFDRFI